MARDDYPRIKKELDQMKTGELRHVRVSQDTGGLITIKKGKPYPQPTIIEEMKPRKGSRVIVPSRVY